MKQGKQFELPSKRRGSLIETINNLNLVKLLMLGLLIYILLVYLITQIEVFLPGIKFNNVSNPDFFDLFYFNFISILTIGYGDLSPVGVLRAITIIEALIGLGIYSTFISIITIKILLPRTNTIVFSKYAYYSIKDNAFMIIYLNTAKQFLSNVETSWYFKLNEDWEICRTGKAPFITKSVQTFYLRYRHTWDTFNKMLHRYDCLRICLTGNLGMSTYSTIVQYNLDEIVIIKDRSELTSYDGFYNVDQYLKNTNFINKFHYRPEYAKLMSEFVKV